MYFFSRQFGAKRFPFYIGETLRIRGRLKQHLRSADIRDVLRSIRDVGRVEIAQGARHFHFGYFKPQGAQDAKNCIRIVQKHMIEIALQSGYPMLNKHLTVIATNTLAFDGNVAGRAIYDDLIEVRR